MHDEKMHDMSLNVLTEPELKHWDRVLDEHATTARVLAAAGRAAERTPEELRKSGALYATCAWCSYAGLPTLDRVIDHTKSE